jgi:membrane protein
VVEAEASRISFMAGSVAYAAFVSILPMLVLLLLVAAVFGGEAFTSTVINATETYLTPAAQGLVTEALAGSTGRVEVSVIGIATLLWGTSRVFRSLDAAFSTLYRTTGRNDVLNTLVDGLVVTFSIGVAVLAILVVSVVYTAFPEVPFVEVANLVGLVLALVVAFFPIYYVFPDTSVTAREVLPGVVIAAVGWALLQGLFQLYASVSSLADLYGALGAVLLFIFWLYFGSLILLVGATVNVVLANRDTPPAHGSTP